MWGVVGNKTSPAAQVPEYKNIYFDDNKYNAQCWAENMDTKPAGQGMVDLNLGTQATGYFNPWHRRFCCFDQWQSDRWSIWCFQHEEGAIQHAFWSADALAQDVDSYSPKLPRLCTTLMRGAAEWMDTYRTSLIEKIGVPWI